MSEKNNRIIQTIKALYVPIFSHFSLRCGTDGFYNKWSSIHRHILCSVCDTFPSTSRFPVFLLWKNKIKNQLPALDLFSKEYLPKQMDCKFWERKIDIYHSLQCHPLCAGCCCLWQVCPGFTLHFKLLQWIKHFSPVPHVKTDNEKAFCWHRAQRPHQQATILKPITLYVNVVLDHFLHDANMLDYTRSRLAYGHKSFQPIALQKLFEN